MRRKKRRRKRRKRKRREKGERRVRQGERGVNNLMFIEHLSYAKQYANCSWIVGDPTTTIWSWYSFYHPNLKMRKLA